tara:strand:- start:458 stop:793 length:336 start_codon:yes stop_codon:yes gene_type:complete
MIKVSVMYPNAPGARFDHAYYRDQHFPMVKALMGDYCLSYNIDRGLVGEDAGVPPLYVAMGHIYCVSIDEFQAGFTPHAAKIMADLPNYTDQIPQIQISEVVPNNAALLVV